MSSQSRLWPLVEMRPLDDSFFWRWIVLHVNFPRFLCQIFIILNNMRGFSSPRKCHERGYFSHWQVKIFFLQFLDILDSIKYKCIWWFGFLDGWFPPLDD